MYPQPHSVLVTVFVNIVETVTRTVNEVAGTSSSGSTVTGTKVVDGRTVVTDTSTTDNNKPTVTGTRTVDGRTVITGLQAKMYGGNIKGYMGGGKVKTIYRPMGGLIPYMANGGFRPMGSDTVPAMLTPGEFVVNRASSRAFAPFLSAINESKYPSILAKNISDNRPIYNIPVQSISQPSYSISAPVVTSSPVSLSNSSYSDNSSAVYNYNVGISVGGTSASPDSIAKSVMNEIKYLDSQRVRNQKVS